MLCQKYPYANILFYLILVDDFIMVEFSIVGDFILLVIFLIFSVKGKQYSTMLIQNVRIEVFYNFIQNVLSDRVKVKYDYSR